MAWVYTQNFDGLNDGDLTGQDSWSGDTSYDVQTTTVLEGTKSVGSVANGEVDIDRAITGVTDGVASIKMRKGSTILWAFQFQEGAVYKFDAIMNPGSGNVEARGATSESAGAFTLNTTHTIDTEFDVSTDQLRVRLDGGTFTAWVDFAATVTTAVDEIRMSKQNAGTQGVYFDDIKDGATAAAAVVTSPTLLTLGVG